MPNPLLRSNVSPRRSASFAGETIRRDPDSRWDRSADADQKSRGERYREPAAASVKRKTANEVWQREGEGLTQSCQTGGPTIREEPFPTALLSASIGLRSAEKGIMAPGHVDTPHHEANTNGWKLDTVAAYRLTGGELRSLPAQQASSSDRPGRDNPRCNNSDRKDLGRSGGEGRQGSVDIHISCQSHRGNVGLEGACGPGPVASSRFASSRVQEDSHGPRIR